MTSEMDADEFNRVTFEVDELHRYLLGRFEMRHMYAPDEWLDETVRAIIASGKYLEELSRPVRSVGGDL